MCRAEPLPAAGRGEAVWRGRRGAWGTGAPRDGTWPRHSPGAGGDLGSPAGDLEESQLGEGRWKSLWNIYLFILCHVPERI